MPIKLYVDDERIPKNDPASWTIVRDYYTAICVLDARWSAIDVVSLDHDLGTDKTGYDIAKYIEEQIEVNNRPPIKTMYAHSGNPVGVQNIMAVFTKYNFKD